MKSLIFVIAFFIIGCGMIDQNYNILIQSKTDVFIDKKTGEAVDRESFQRAFIINLVEDKFTTSIPLTKEKIVSTIISKRKIKDRVINDTVIEFCVVNSRTDEHEFYVLWEKPNNQYELFQEISDTDTRIFFNPDLNCVH